MRRINYGRETPARVDVGGLGGLSAKTGRTIEIITVDPVVR